MKSWSRFTFAWCALAIALATPAAAQQSCARVASNALAYQVRGDRCEGLYALNVGGNLELPVHSLTASLESFDPGLATPVIIRWVAPNETIAVHLRAQPVRFHVNYAMETLQDIRGGMYRWPTTVMASAGLHAEDIGLVGTMRARIGSRDRDVYLPLRVSQRQGSPPGPLPYTLVLYPVVSVARATLTVDRLDQGGARVTTIVSNRPLGAFVPDAGMIVVLPKLNEPGYYQVRVSATLATGASSTAIIWLYHAN